MRPDVSCEQPVASSPSPEPKTWRTGTLVYTSAGVTALFLWLLWGDFALSMRDRSVGSMAQWYLNRLSISNLLFGLIISSFPALIGLVLGPIISVKSDRHRGKRGRRIPFLLVTTPIAAIGIVGLGVTPLLAKWIHGMFPAQNEILISLICFGIFWAAFEFATIAGKAVFDGLINDVVPKPLLGRFYGLFRAVSLIDGIIFNFWIMGKVPIYYTVILVVVGVFYGVAFMWVCFKVKEGDYPPPPPLDPNRKGFVQRFCDGARTYFRECFTNSYYISIFIMIMSATLAFVPINIFCIPYALSLGVKEETFGHFLALTYAISLGLSFFIGWLVDLLHPLRMAIGTLVGYALVTIWGSLYATTATAFLTAWVMHGVLSGCYFTSAASLGQRLFPQSKFAQFASAGGIFLALGQMVTAPLIGTVIDRAGNVYRYTFVAGCGLTLIALVAGCYVYAKFVKLGGTKFYTAPE